VLNCVVVALAVLLMTITVTLRERTNPGLLGVAMVSVVSFGQTLSSFISYWTTLETSLAAITRIKNFILETPEERSCIQRTEMAREWPAEPIIKIQNLSASYQ
jgi:ABC-type multidrug transport system fused ATPase/permease subunit